MRPRDPSVRSVRRARRLVAAAVVAPVLALSVGCGAEEPYDPTGVDQLVIPTPTPRPSDFVSRIDNPLLPLTAGSTWTYSVAGTVSGTRTVTVRPGLEEVAGVGTTRVVTVDADGTTIDHFAQDREGNVWWFGREGQWEAGVDGAEAGLAMPAMPRIGDGYRSGLAPGVLEDRVEVVSVTATMEYAGKELTGVNTETRSEIDPADQVSSFYAAGPGLVVTEGAGLRVQLTSYDAGGS